jgi:hypothetical protein
MTWDRFRRQYMQWREGINIYYGIIDRLVGMTMNIDEVRRRVAEIEAERANDEMAHCKEDELHQDVLRAIADGTCDDPVACAAAALETEKIEFARRCA